MFDWLSPKSSQIKKIILGRGTLDGLTKILIDDLEVGANFNSGSTNEKLQTYIYAMIGVTYYMCDIANLTDDEVEKCRVYAERAMQELPEDYKGIAQLSWNTTLAKMERLLNEWARRQAEKGKGAAS